jgi:hypothetical protein
MLRGFARTQRVALVSREMVGVISVNLCTDVESNRRRRYDRAKGNSFRKLANAQLNIIVHDMHFNHMA